MTAESIITLIFSGGLIAAIASIVTTIMSSYSEEKRAKRERADTVSDRKFELKKEAYIAALEEFNFAGLAIANGLGGRNISVEEARARNKAMTLFDIFAPNTVREKAGDVMNFLRTPVPTTPAEHQNFINALIDAQRELDAVIKSDLGVD
jgi:hypothetical protein